MPRWKKLGRVFHLESSEHRSTTHAQGAVTLVKEECVRVYFAARGKEGKSYPAYVDLARNELTRVLKVHEQPVMALGAPGTFDDEGVMPACMLGQGKSIWLYYSGWNRRGVVPYHNATGLAESHDGGSTFKRVFEGPVLERTPEEPYLAVT